ncbi:hypothetical protein SI65_01581 [Aspergillus cristatus]|uniref:BTB domain-containing protein n=1 Tax=Aspergillus cristatus TaxID=573508 RepID=A0A1E3BT97_ASPCR|nr:hypothetical protein SI65_01581 [Aspergillus cristatus]
MISTKRPLPPENTSKYRPGKTCSRTRNPVREARESRRLERRHKPSSPQDRSPSGSPIVTLSVGPEKRLFACHEDILCASPYFATFCREQFGISARGKRIELPNEQPEVLSCVLEYLYRGDYTPRLVHNARREQWELEDMGTDSEGQSHGATMFHQAAGGVILRDTAVYCAAEKYTLEPLKRLALRKQGLHTGIQCSTILTSARYAYANTPDTESKLRAHYLALIIRSRSTFKRSGTMQMEMEEGGKLFFDLFVAMCNHMDDLSAMAKRDR